MASPFSGKSRYDATPVIVVVTLIALIIGVLLIWQNAGAQQRYSTLRDGQTTGLEQRTEQTQLLCAVWTALLKDDTAQVAAATRETVDSICAAPPTPSPTVSGQ